jgi:hypothetical protein
MQKLMCLEVQEIVVLKMGEEIEEVDEKKLPWIYRLIMKIPKISLDSAPGWFHGIYWAILIPIFLAFEFLLSMLLLIFLPFPLNIVVVCIIPLAVLIFFVRIMLERDINWWRATFAKPFKWDVEKATKEYISLLKKQRSRSRG